MPILLKKAPFLRLVIPLMAGIIIQHHWHFSSNTAIFIIGAAGSFSLVFYLLPPFYKLRYRNAQGLGILAAVFGLGMLLYTVKDLRYQADWAGRFFAEATTITTTLTEKPVEKTNSYKATATVRSVEQYGKIHHTRGNLILYFQKDTAVSDLQLGQTITFQKQPSAIRNSGNPGSFNYRQYSIFNGITHTVFLSTQEYQVSGMPVKKSFNSLLDQIRSYVLKTLKTYISGKKEQGLAQALLIGYRDELDKDLLQSYINTGVVHVIAVSGMHLALIFWLLHLMFSPLLKSKKTYWLHPVLVLAILWLFTLIAGGAASIVRAAVMFSFIMVGKSLHRNVSVYNSLAGSAFLLLCINPYWLCDLGFQLSYAAVVSIILFYKPIYNLLFIRNKILDRLWQLAAVSIAAQLLTSPIAMYHFHQLPVYFLITNLLIVPVSSLVLVGELILVLISPLQALAKILGSILSGCIWWMNSFIENLEKFPLSVWDGIQINELQTLLLFVIIAGGAWWLIENKKPGFWVLLIALMGFLGFRAVSFSKASEQRKIIVYNINKHTALDFIEGRNHLLIADSAVQPKTPLWNMNIKPATILFRLKPARSLPHFQRDGNFFSFYDQKILLINSSVTPSDTAGNLEPDLVILSGNPRLYISDLLKIMRPSKIVISSSVPAWKAGYWKRDCDSLQVPYYDVSEKGAFVMSLR